MADRVQATWDQVLSLRARRHFLSGPQAGGAVEVARRLSGVHAQLWVPAAGPAIIAMSGSGSRTATTAAASAAASARPAAAPNGTRRATRTPLARVP